MNSSLLRAANMGYTEECTLLCKDTPIYRLRIYGYDVNNIIVLHTYNSFVINEDLISETIKNRFAIFNRLGVKESFNEIGISSKLELLKITHGVSLSDCLWIRFDNESVEWNDINPYKSTQSFDINWFLNKGNAYYKMVLPNYSTDGTFPKCWVTENGKHRLIKAGTSGAYNAGLEPLSEHMFTKIADALMYNNYVRYDLNIVNYPDHYKYSIPGIVKDNTILTEGRLSTICDCFTSDSKSLVTARELGLKSYEECLQFAEQCTNNSIDLALMLLCDCIGLNTDRHLGNIGFLYDTNTFEILSVAPMYDNNLSLLCYWDDRVNLDEYVSQLRAFDGRPFSDLASKLLCSYPELRNRLSKINLLVDIDFKIEFITSNRGEILNSIVVKNIEHYLQMR